MAEEKEEQANSGTEQTKASETGCPSWDNWGADGNLLPPFFSPKEELKRQGFLVHFLHEGPRKETQNTFNPETNDLWFDIIHYRKAKDEKVDGAEVEPVLMTWTINQISLLTELRKYAPLRNKVFRVKLVPVDDEFKENHPKYKGKDRYDVKLVEIREPPKETVRLNEEVEDI